MLRTIAQLALVLTIASTLLARAIWPLAPTPPRVTEQGISYTQLRHLVVATVFLVFGILFALWFVSRASEVLTLLAISVILAVALRPTVDRMSDVRIPVVSRTARRALAILLIYLILALVAVGIGLLAIPVMVGEIERLTTSLPGYLENLNEALRGLQDYPFVPDLVSLQGQLVGQLLANLSQAINVLLFAVSALGGVLSVGLVLVFTFFLIMDADPIYEHLTSLLPPSQQGRARRISARMGRKIEGWLKGTILLSLILGSATALAMWLLGMPYPLLLGLAAGLFELVPMLGAYLGAAPSVLVALLSQPPWTLVAVVVYFVAAQQVENNVLAPHIMGREVELPPLLIILALLSGAAIMGIVGALLAVPVAAVLQVLWTDLLVPEIKGRQVRQSGP